MARQKAFTLGELTFVIVILVVLAAFGLLLAIDNMEPANRSPVSRTSNNLHTLSIAMESYRIDNNSYPASERDSPLGALGGGRQIDLRLLTTPVSYLSAAVPHDIFRTRAGLADDRYPVYAVAYTTTTTTNVPNAVTYPRTAWMTWSIGPDGLTNTAGYCSFPQVLANEASPRPAIGTDRNGYPIGGAGYSGMRYDATNGSRSYGDIYRFEGEALTRPN